VLVIELDPKRPLGELETKLRTLAWAPDEELLDAPAVSRAPTVQTAQRTNGATRPARVTPPPQVIAMPPPPQVIAMPPPPAMPPVPPPSVVVMPQAHPPPPPAMPAPPQIPSSVPLSLSPSSVSPAPMAHSAMLHARQGPPPPPPPRSSPPGGSVAVQAKSVGSGPAFAGDLEEFSLPDLLEFLRNSHRTGLLVCSTMIGTGTVQLSRGMIVAADSPHALDLREHFVTRAEIAPELRRTIAALPHECFGDDMIEGVLVSRDLVPRDEVERARIARIYSAFREMMGWTSGRFSFDPAVPIVTNPALALSAQSILMKIYQEQDELER
jgi:hypothetical protein